MKVNSIRYFVSTTLIAALASGCAPAGLNEARMDASTQDMSAVAEKSEQTKTAKETKPYPYGIANEKEAQAAQRVHEAARLREQARAAHNQALQSSRSAQNEYDKQRKESQLASTKARNAGVTLARIEKAATSAQHALKSAQQNLVNKSAALTRIQNELATASQKRLTLEAEAATLPKEKQDKAFSAKLKAAVQAEENAKKKLASAEKYVVKANADIEKRALALTKAQSEIEPARKALIDAQKEDAAQKEELKKAQSLANARAAAAKKTAEAERNALVQLRKAQNVIQSMNQNKARGVADRIVIAVHEHENAKGAMSYAQSQAAKATKAKLDAERDFQKKTQAAESARAKAEAQKEATNKAAQEAVEKSLARKQAQIVYVQADAENKTAQNAHAQAEAKASKARSAAQAAAKALRDAESRVSRSQARLEDLRMRVNNLNTHIARIQGEVEAARVRTSNAEAAVAAQPASAPAPQVPSTPESKKTAVKAPTKPKAVPKPAPTPAERELANARKELAHAEKELFHLTQLRDEYMATIAKLEAALPGQQSAVAQATATKSNADAHVINEERPAALALQIANEKKKIRDQAKRAFDTASVNHSRAQKRSHSAAKALASANADANSKAKLAASSEKRHKEVTERRDQALARLNAAKDRLAKAKHAEEHLNTILAKDEGAYEIRTDEWSHEQEMKSIYRAAVWAKAKNAKFWTDLTLAEIRAHRTELDKARDVNKFCPGYAKAGNRLQQICWLRLISGLVRYESSFNPATKFVEPDTQKLSAGLMALTPSECKMASTAELLVNPVLNLSCGIRIMVRLISRHGVIAGEPPRRGAAAYWSVLREPYEAHGYKLGKQEKVIEFTRTYKQY